MPLHARAGQPAQPNDLIDVVGLISDYFQLIPHPDKPGQAVSFGTSGHRGSASKLSFNECHILAIAQAVVDYRQKAGITGPMYVGIDTHALSRPAYQSVLQVLTANQLEVIVQAHNGYTPTPVVSQAIVAHNRANQAQADGLIITPSHNPPADGGIKYNPPHGGPADTDITKQIETDANAYIAAGLQGVKRSNSQLAHASGLIVEQDLQGQYIAALEQVIDLKAIAKAGVRLIADPLGGSGVAYWDEIAERFGLQLTTVNTQVDPQFGFMSLDKDGKVRMDCSSPYAMASLLNQTQEYDIAIGNDPDFDRHGIVCQGDGLMNPNHFLAVCIDYLADHRPHWGREIAIGKTLVSSAMIDRVCAYHGLELTETPVGFKWFVEGLSQGTVGFCGEESAGACLLTRQGDTWCTDKDGIVLGLLAAEILAVTGQTPAQRYRELERKHGRAFYQRNDAPIKPKAKKALLAMQAQDIKASELAGEPISAVMTEAPGNGAAIGGVKVCTQNAWFAARPSGTEPLYKLYAESFVSEAHLAEVIADAEKILAEAIKG
ncbi:phosphoglucomutase (alpha-D-glucose-1,6-bisphosphate-dependent) [Paraferrimonas sedimenticola]|uniref:Phosphoglucomutase n=1 Tax=Paraferrimonas sedimenticola TaxID=375674 RepID=A0AA37W0F3_9GAMM|nr:phosphoglucomutase (alpha-D-glucose-1,6-bisphosphate-dependent) [Paraferrimonas sedimenticola]GLP96250.1 phosphoglucomutase, alpha-D-glucose phosphate-specific [Paraferrimonas sedimenticola]